MTRLLVGNDVNEDLRLRNSASWYCQRLAWFAQDGDVLVLPVPPDEDWLTYVTDLTGTRRSTLSIVVPPSGSAQPGELTRERLHDHEFIAALHAAIAGRPIAEVYALWPDAAVVELARTLGAETTVPGHGFLSQGGDALANSKVFFRAVAAGIGLPVAEGSVVRNRERAEEEVVRLLDAGYSVMVKNEFLSGGWGNDIVTRTENVRRIGARRLVELEGRFAVRDYLAERWGKLSNGGSSPVVVERYVPDSVAVFAEFDVRDDGVHFGGQGQMLSVRYGGTEIIPAPEVAPDRVAEVISGGRRLCEAMRAIGYRGILSADAIVTPTGDVLFTEYNGRSTGSTHTYGIIGKKIVGPDYAEDRLIVERLGTAAWSVGSFGAAADVLHDSGLHYDQATRRGVILLHAFDPATNSVPYVVVAEDLAATADIERMLGKLFDFIPPTV